jgi:hypothetical protein
MKMHVACRFSKKEKKGKVFAAGYYKEKSKKSC